MIEVFECPIITKCFSALDGIQEWQRVGKGKHVWFG